MKYPILVFALDLLDERDDETVLEVFTSKMGIISSGLDIEDAFKFLDCQKKQLEVWEWALQKRSLTPPGLD
jgi:hypothetical protein